MYLTKLNANPLPMQMATGTMLGYAGDAIAQLWLEKAEKYDFIRGTRIAAFTFFIWAPLNNRWMIFAEKRFGGNSLKTLTKKVSIDQFMLGPFLTTSFFTFNERE